MSPLPPLASAVPERTPLLDMPLIMPSQAQKHVTHNEAVRALDTLVHLAVVARGASEPPADAAEGDRFIVGPEPSGAWLAARADQVAALEDGAWTFRTPRLGWRAFVANAGLSVLFDGTAWVEEGGDPERVDRLGVNAEASDTNRLAVSSPATLLTHEGGDHRVVVNRRSEADTASLVFQTGWSGGAEFGLAGDAHWRVKVSPNGAAWRDAVVASAETGAVSFPHGTDPERRVPAAPAAGRPADEVLGFPNLVTAPFDRIMVGCTTDRIYFCPFLVDRPTVLYGLHVAQHGASSTAGARWRAGVHRLGESRGAAWRIGDLVFDCGTLPADGAGHKWFDAPSPTALEPGWYVSALITDGAGAAVRTTRSMTPGLSHMVPYASGASADLRFGNAAVYMHMRNQGAIVSGGLPRSWSANASPVPSTRFNTLHLAIPRWRAW